MDIKTLLNNSEYVYDYNGECPICLEKDSLRLCRKLDCNHVFHCECIDKWLSDKKSCPNCRNKLVKKDLSKVVFTVILAVSIS